MRFSNRVENYIKYRPHYPAALTEYLRDECGLTPNSIVADIGAGTGILTELFLKNGNTVYAVEPNREMRTAAEQLLRNYPGFHGVDGTAEATSLPEGSVDWITTGQAFHWFDADRTKLEFARILRPHGWVAVTWNDRRIASNPFHRAYEEFLQRYGTDYQSVSESYPNEERMSDFFKPRPVNFQRFDNFQTFDFDGLKGRVLSASYIPPEGDPRYPALLKALHALFETYQTAGRVTLEYDTLLYCGQLTNS